MASPLATLPSDELLARLRALVRRDNALEADLLAHLGEVDGRRLYLEQACSSMFTYCVRVLHFSEAAAYKRIASARAARRHPELLEAVRRGDLHLTAASLLAAQLSATNCAELIDLARHRTTDEIRRLLADRRPRPDVPTSVHPISAPMQPPPTPPTTDPTSIRNGAPSEEASTAAPVAEPFTADSPTRAAATATEPMSPPPPPDRRARTEPLGGERYCVRFTADREMFAQLQDLQALMRHQIPDGDLGKILARAVAVLLEQVRNRKFAESSAPRSRAKACARASRHIPAAIRRAVSNRDGERCTYVSANGRRCEAREFLEFDHRDPWVRSRIHSVAGIRLRCRAHNQHAAERDFGKAHMERSRKRSGNTAGSTGTEGRPLGAIPTSRLVSKPARADESRPGGGSEKTPHPGDSVAIGSPDPRPGGRVP